LPQARAKEKKTRGQSGLFFPCKTRIWLQDSGRKELAFTLFQTLILTSFPQFFDSCIFPLNFYIPNGALASGEAKTIYNWNGVSTAEKEIQ